MPLLLLSTGSPPVLVPVALLLPYAPQPAGAGAGAGAGAAFRSLPVLVLVLVLAESSLGCRPVACVCGVSPHQHPLAFG